MMIENLLPYHALLFLSIFLIIFNVILDFIEDLHIRTLFIFGTWMFLYYLFLIHIENIVVCQLFWIPEMERNLDPLTFYKT